MSKEKDAKAIKLLGGPDKLINQVVIDPQKQKWVLEKITKGGPAHKQLQHTLVLNRLQKLATLVQKRNALSLEPLKGWDIKTEHDDELIPVQFPDISIDGLTDSEEIFDAMVKGPAHEILYTTLLLQIIERMIKAEQSSKKQV